MGEMGLLVEDLAVVTTDPESGIGRILPAERNTMLEGALLLDLAEAGCARLFLHEARIGRAQPHVQLNAPSSPLPPLLANALTRARPETTPIHGNRAMHRIGKGLMPELRAHLVQRGIWRERRQRRLLVLSIITFPAANGYADELRDRLRKVLAGERPATPGDLALVALLAARKQFRAVFAKPEAKLAQQRAEQLIDHDSAVGLVHRLVRERSLGTYPYAA